MLIMDISNNISWERIKIHEWSNAASIVVRYMN